MKILGIETSCDETAAAVVEDGRKVLSNVIASQIREHIIYGGVVPEIASRLHVEAISPVVKKAVEDAGIRYADLDAVAVTYAPGLIGSLLVGVNFAKGLSYSTGLPLVPVHHLRAHIAADYITNPDLEPPFLCLVVSGGHSHIVAVNGYTDFAVIGKTLDDAAGECMDKSGRVLGLPYPGGANLDAVSAGGDPDAYKLPRPRVTGREFDFSFSGLKTAVANVARDAERRGISINVPDLGASCIKTVVESLVNNAVKAAEKFDFQKIALAGGVSANSRLRSRMKEICGERGWELYMPEIPLCADNAAMVGAQGFFELKNGNIAGLELNAFASMPISRQNV